MVTMGQAHACPLQKEITLFRKLITGGVALAVAAAALVLVSVAGGATTASAVINGVSVTPTTISVNGTTTLTVDSDTGTNVQILSTVGTLVVASCDGVALAAGACLAANIVGEGTANVTVCGTALGGVCVGAADAGTDTIILTYTAPATGPSTATITSIQGTSAKTATVNIRGVAATVATSILRAASTSTTGCVGTTQNVVQSSAAGGAGNTTGFLCTLVKDSAGNRTPNAAVIYTTTAGTLSSASGVTGATGQVANAATLTAGTTGTTGTTATITTSSSGVVTTSTLKFGGPTTSCSIATNPTTVEVGGSSVVSVTPLDSSGGPIPDGVAVGVVQTNSGSGSNAAILNAAPTTSNGTASTSLIAAIPGALALGANIGATTCTGSVTATSTVVPPVGDGGTPGVSGFAPGAGQSGLTVFNNLASVTDAFGLVCGTNDVGSSLSMTNASGATFAYVNGAPAFANSGFVAGITFGGAQASFLACA